MKQAIQETLDLHHAAFAANMSYTDYREELEIPCTICSFTRYRCTRCPWTIFEGRTCRLNEYNDYGASVARLTSWLEKCK
jgi:hypothetical protein